MITVNSKQIEYETGTNLAAIAAQLKPDADLAIINGYPAAPQWNKITINDNDDIVLITKDTLPTEEELETAMMARHSPGVHKKLKSSTVGIAGLGGLGSTVAVALARTGVGRLIIVDFDIIEPTNLNRQQYFIDQIGQSKALAMRDNLKKINPYIKIDAIEEKLQPNEIVEIFTDADIVAECFDLADQKQMIVETILSKMKIPIVSASGMAGVGKSNDIKTQKINKNLILVGDMESAASPGSGLMAPRVGIAACHQANAIVEYLINKEI